MATTGPLRVTAFRSAVERSADGTLFLDREGCVQFVNPAGLAMLIASGAGDMQGRSFAALAPASIHDAIRKAMASAMAGRAARFEAEVGGGIGQETWWDIDISPLGDAAGAVDGLIVVIRDISPMKLAGREAASRLPEVAATAAVFRSALRHAQFDAWRYDVVNQRVTFTPELLETLGKSVRDQPYVEALSVWAPEDRGAFEQCLNEAIRTCGQVNFEGRIVTPMGEERWLRVLGEAEVVDGRCIALRGASQDITEERAALTRLLASEETARRAAEAMSGFLATMGHEIRTPLNGVLGMAQAMALGELPDQQRENLKVIQSSGQSLLVLLNDLLDLSKIEAGRIELEDGLIDPSELARGAQVFGALLEAKGIGFTVTVDPAARGLWAGDPARVGQILNNLISNAVKFTERGTVAVELVTEAGAFVMRVRDTGVGIAPDRLDAVFSRFTQADSSTTRRFGGTGLGLTISQELARMMGGTITLDSVEGQGSTFTVRLPLPRMEAAAAAASETPAIEDRGPELDLSHTLRILAAEDNPTNQLVLKTLLMGVGIEPVVVADGRQALDAWRGGTWDVVLMDIHMPVLDGVQAVTEMRAIERRERRRRTPVIALTANAMTHQRDEYLAAGMDALVAKPIDLAVLIETIETILAQRDEGASREAAA